MVTLATRRRDLNRQLAQQMQPVKSSIDRLTKSNRNILWCDINEGNMGKPMRSLSI